MKKTIYNIIFVGLISILILPLCVNAKNITSLKTTESSGKITATGTTEEGVLAIAALVYQGNDLVYMETCEVTNQAYSCLINDTLKNGKYTVKVADYNGGDYTTDEITVTNSNPKTGDDITKPIIIGGIALIGLIGLGIYYKKTYSKK